MHRVVITGAGVVSSLGFDTASFWRGCLDARGHVAPIPEQWHDYADFRSQHWCPLPSDYQDQLKVSRVQRSQHDWVALIAAAACEQALREAGFEIQPVSLRMGTHALVDVNPERVGVYMGTGIGGAQTFLRNFCHHILARPREVFVGLSDSLRSEALPPQELERFEQALALLRYPKRFNPFVVSMLMPNAASAHVGIKYGFNGSNATFGMACAAGTAALGNGFRAIRHGFLDMVVGGGTEFLEDPYGAIFHGFDAARTLAHGEESQRINRPFDEDRNGFLFAQGGACVLILESLAHATARNAPILAEVVGYGESFDAHSMMSLAPGGPQIERMLMQVLADAGLKPSDIDYVNCHGTGTVVNDLVETEILQRVFGTAVPVNSTKSILGHTIGASGAFEALVCALSLKHQRTHACRNLDRPLAPLNFVRQPDPLMMQHALSQSFAFGGHNAALVFKRWDD